MDDDFLLATQLQEQFDNEYETSLFSSNGFEDHFPGQSSKRRKVEAADGDVVPYLKSAAHPKTPLSIVDETWELLDPHPDVRVMFLEFNDMFFWGKLSGVEVKWSPRMTLCAGVCSYEGRGGLCSIRLSEPLLKLRPRKDLVETLLHEMIHALLFVTQNNRDREGHGPEFCKHMNRINKATGTKISIYHSFHDEVDVYRQHWWKCNGPCQYRKPYFGFVKRAMNRAPSALDPWWEDHKRTCGGTYAKVKEPEGYSKKGKNDARKDGKTSEKKSSGSGRPSSATTGTSGSQDIRSLIPFSGKGFVLGGTSQSTMSSPSHKPAAPVAKTPLSSLISSPERPMTPSSPAKSLNSPVCPDLDSSGTSSVFPSIRPATSTGQTKRSVSNTRVFVNINGSPVRIPKPHGGSRIQEASKIKQRSIEDLFISASFRKSQSSTSSSEPKREPSASGSRTIGAATVSSVCPKQQNNNAASSPRTSRTSPSESIKYSPVVWTGNNGSPAKPTQPKYSGHSNGDRTLGDLVGSQASRKRPWDDRNGSVTVFDFFKKQLGGDSATSRESAQTKSPAAPPRTATSATSSSSSSDATVVSSAAPHSVAPSSSSSAALTVRCPVCQAKVLESRINEHLDSCLS